MMARALKVVWGITLIVAWQFGHFSWAAFVFLVLAMGIPGNGLSGVNFGFVILFYGMAFGLLLTALAGVPVGLSIFLEARHKQLMRIAKVTFLIGAAIQAAPQLPDGRPVLWHGVTVREQVIVSPAAG